MSAQRIPSRRDGEATPSPRVKARRDGELFLYVNDAVFMWPIPHDLLYRNNKGTGTVCIERLGRPPSQPATRDAPALNAVCTQNASDRSRPAAR